MMTPTDRVFRTAAASDLIKVSASTLTKWRVRGEGPPFVRIGARLVGYLEADLLAWLASRRAQSTSEARSEAGR
jgi:predicted DNA-binding transcriptional regulator AlpA